MFRQILVSGSVTLALLGTAGVAQAQVSPDDAACRAAIHKNSGKLAKTAMKAVDGCVKGALSGKLGPATDCNNLAVADAKGKVTGAEGKLRTGISGKCLLPDNAAVIGAMSNCPSPANLEDAAGATPGVDDFSELAECEIAINTDGIETLRRYILVPKVSEILAHPSAKVLSKCANTIAKAATKLWSTVSKERGKCQTGSDSSPGPYAYGCSTYDLGAKIAGAVTKLNDAVDKDCSDLILTAGQRGLIGACDSSVAGIKACVADAVRNNAGGATAAAFEFAGVCPTEARLTVNAGTGPGSQPSTHLNNTTLDTGFSGFGHDLDFADGVMSRVNLSCTGDCSVCTLTTNCEEGNCRCSNNAATLCTTPFVSGGVCGAGTCQVHFGPPQALSAGGAPVCSVNVLQQEIVGAVDAGTGDVTAEVEYRARIHTGISLAQPCPTCSGAEIGSAGNCIGGSRNGMACTTDAIDAAFGNTSYDCPPSLAANISGTGVKMDLELTSGAVSLPFGDACDAPFGALTCACGVCSLDTSVGCNSDAECALVALGSCVNGGGAASLRRPNGCDDLVCSPVSAGSEEGTCLAGPNDLYCDGELKGDGEGLVPCLDNAECTSVGAGSCTLSKRRECFLNPITASGSAGTAGAELVAVACRPPTLNSGVNAGIGWPGAERMKLDLDFVAFCPDGVTPFELGGANCTP